MWKEEDNYDFEIELVVERCVGLGSVDSKIAYLNFILKEVELARLVARSNPISEFIFKLCGLVEYNESLRNEDRIIENSTVTDAQNRYELSKKPNKNELLKVKKFVENVKPKYLQNKYENTLANWKIGTYSFHLFFDQGDELEAELSSFEEKIRIELNYLQDNRESLQTNFQNDENSIIKKKHPPNKKNQKTFRTDDEDKIKEYIDLAIKLGERPKNLKGLNKTNDKTMYAKLKNKNFLIKLTTIIKEKTESNYNYSDGTFELLREMLSFYSNKLMLISNQETKIRKAQNNEIEYNDLIDYDKNHTKKNRNPDY